ncbi:hypothetical protein VNO78_22289 [Psophocarpus tetragonolobus]|uniref:Uncharacterized protein n=1 Tax=Psophocarpus tetragonolobus TaxID=3891 RepID=A0AAN9SEN8_PSOTE
MKLSEKAIYIHILRKLEEAIDSMGQDVKAMPNAFAIANELKSAAPDILSNNARIGNWNIPTSIGYSQRCYRKASNDITIEIRNDTQQDGQADVKGKTTIPIAGAEDAQDKNKAHLKMVHPNTRDF